MCVCVCVWMEGRHNRVRGFGGVSSTCGMVGQFVNFLTPSRSAASERTFLAPYLTPAAVETGRPVGV